MNTRFGLFVALLALVTLTGCLEGGNVCPGEDPALFRGLSPSSLEDDCRCNVATSVDLPPLCLDPTLAEERIGKLGDGPQVGAMDGRIRNGDLWADRGEIIVAVSLGANTAGFVLGVDIETGDRRIVSGRYVDPAFGFKTVGEGPEWQEPIYALRGPDDMVYVYSTGSKYDPEISGQASINEIHRVDPDTGVRELVWKWRLDKQLDGYGSCLNGDPDQPSPLQLALEGGAFEMSSKGSFYIGTVRNAIPKPGVGFIEISADGSECRVVSMTAGDPGNDYEDGVGEGFDFGIAVETINEVNGQLLVMDNNSLFRVDPETGLRERLMGGVFPGILEYDEGRDLYHLTAVEPPYASGGYIGVIDLNEREIYRSWGCTNIDENHPHLEGCIDHWNNNAVAMLVNNQGWLLPGGEYMLAVNGRSRFVKIELQTGNANHFSF